MRCGHDAANIGSLLVQALVWPHHIGSSISTSAHPPIGPPSLPSNPKPSLTLQPYKP